MSHTPPTPNLPAPISTHIAGKCNLTFSDTNLTNCGDGKSSFQKSTATHCNLQPQTDCKNTINSKPNLARFIPKSRITSQTSIRPHTPPTPKLFSADKTIPSAKTPPTQAILNLPIAEGQNYRPQKTLPAKPMSKQNQFQKYLKTQNRT